MLNLRYISFASIFLVLTPDLKLYSMLKQCGEIAELLCFYELLPSGYYYYNDGCLHFHIMFPFLYANISMCVSHYLWRRP